MKTIYLVRHGHIENPKDIFYDKDIPLSSVGAKEMIGIAEDIKKTGCTPERIISSPYLRARESAEIIAHVFGTQEVEFDEHLIDWQVGDWIGKPLEAFRQFAGFYNKPFIPNFDGLETYDEMAKRVLPVMRELRESMSANSCAIIVGHREPLASAILKLKNRPDNEMREIDLPKGSAWKLTFDDDRLKTIEKAFDHASNHEPNGV